MGVAWTGPVESAHAGVCPEKGPRRLRLFALTVQGAPKATVLRGGAEHRNVTVAHFDTSNADPLRERRLLPRTWFGVGRSTERAHLLSGAPDKPWDMPPRLGKLEVNDFRRARTKAGVLPAR